MKYTRYGTGIILSVVAIVYLLYAVKVFPIPGTDSSSFLPPALTFAQGRGLTNPFYYLSPITDATGSHLYNYYVPFYSWFLGFCVAAVPGTKTIFVVCALLTIVGLMLYRKALEKNSPANPGKPFIAAALLSIPFLATYSLPTIGRPEQLTAPLLLVLFLLYRNRRRMNYWVYNTLLVVIFAVLLATQVTGFYFAFLVFLIVEFLGHGHAPRLVLVNVLRAICVLLLFYLVMQASPNGFSATVEGISRHSRLLFRRGGRSIGQFAFYWLFSPFNVGFLVIFGACIRYWYLYLRETLPAVAAANKWIIACLHVAIGAGMFAFVLHTPPTVYNVAQFIYVMLLFVLLSYERYPRSRYHSLILPSLILTFLAGNLLFLRTLVLFADNETDGRSYNAARRKLAEVQKKYGRCFTQLNLWSLYDDPYKVQTIKTRYMYPPDNTVRPGDIVVMPLTDTTGDIPGSEVLETPANDGRNFYHVVHPGDIIVIPQAYKDIPQRLLDRSEILEDWRTTNVRTFMGLPLTRHPYGYSFVVLKVK